MKRESVALKVLSTSVLASAVCFSFPLIVFAGTSIKINNAQVDNAAETLIVGGLNFPIDGSLEVTIGDTLIDNCSVSEMSVNCSITGTPALTMGGSWTVQLSAGNSPSANAAIDVYVATSSTTGCNPGDYVQCYPGESVEIGVGICQSGTRTCGLAGQFEECVGYQSPNDEWPDNCNDGLDNDCDGVIDNGCDVLDESPKFYVGPVTETFRIPPGVTSLEVAAWGAGGGGAGGVSQYDIPLPNSVSGGGGGSGGFKAQTVPVQPGDLYEVTIGSKGFGGAPNAPGQKGGDAVLRGPSGTVLYVAGGSGAYGAQGGDPGFGGNAGHAGEECDALSDVGANGQGNPGAGGLPVDWRSYSMGAGGPGGRVNCLVTSCPFLGLGECSVNSSGVVGSSGEQGGLVIWWSQPAS